MPITSTVQAVLLFAFRTVKLCISFIVKEQIPTVCRRTPTNWISMSFCICFESMILILGKHFFRQDIFDISIITLSLTVLIRTFEWEVIVFDLELKTFLNTLFVKPMSTFIQKKSLSFLKEAYATDFARRFFILFPILFHHLLFLLLKFPSNCFVLKHVSPHWRVEILIWFVAFLRIETLFKLLFFLVLEIWVRVLLFLYFLHLLKGLILSIVFKNDCIKWVMLIFWP